MQKEESMKHPRNAEKGEMSCDGRNESVISELAAHELCLKGWWDLNIGSWSGEGCLDSDYDFQGIV